MSEQDTTLTDDQIRGESTFEETPDTGTETPEEGDSDGMDTGGGSDSDESDSIRRFGLRFRRHGRAGLERSRDGRSVRPVGSDGGAGKARTS